MTDDRLCFNGIDGTTGGYGVPPMTGAELAHLLRGGEPPENLGELRHRSSQAGQSHYGVKEGVDPKKLDESGWGVVFTHDADPAVREALAPLLTLRREQAGERFRIYEGSSGLRPGEAKAKFLARHGAGPGPADPAKVPYYLLLVGGPEAISYRFQSQLDVQYAVGRIAFDTPEHYACYAASVVAAEKGEARRARRVGFWGASHPDDKATRLAERHLVGPLADYLRARRADWQIDALVADAAGKAELARLLGGEATPALLFTTSHGMEFPAGDPRQLPHQGALLCGDWPGPAAWQGRGAIPQDFYFAGDDLAGDARLLGLIGFFFACFGGGTPHLDEFAKQALRGERAVVAPHAFLAALPSRMLAHPKGGALAVVGHVDRAWGYSFSWQGAGAQTAVFESTLDRLLDGHPIGSALEYFNERYAELSTMLADQLEEAEFGAEPDPFELAGLWTANNDARGYAVIGDPAVRLQAVAPGETASELAVIEIATRPAAPPVEEPAEEPTPELAFGVAQSTEPEEVRFSAHHPRALELGTTRQLLVYAHLAAALAEVEADAVGRLGREARQYRRAEAARGARLAAGTEITLVPAGEGLLFDPPQTRIVWSPPWQRAEFSLRADGSRVGHVIEAALACYVGPLLVAELRLPVVVPKPGETLAGPFGEPAAQSTATARMYQAVFASYSHADTAVVEAMETACKALGMDYLRDVMTLKSGQSWSDELLAMVERADVFQLFWSAAAAGSAYVEQEWQHALRLAAQKGGAFIRPIYWQKPLAPVPSELAHLHFAPVELGGLAPAPAPRTSAEHARPVALALPAELAELAELTVNTWSSPDPTDAGSARLLARTRVALAGDVDTWLAAEAPDHSLSVHETAVWEAVRARLAYLELFLRGGRA